MAPSRSLEQTLPISPEMVTWAMAPPRVVAWIGTIGLICRDRASFAGATFRNAVEIRGRPLPFPHQAPLSSGKLTQDEPVMPLSIRQVHPLFVGDVSGVDMRTSRDTAAIRDIVDDADRCAILIFPSQTITDEQHVAFSRSFGRLCHGRWHRSLMGNRPRDDATALTA